MCEPKLEGTNFIIENCLKIDRMQKEVLSEYPSCITCETSLISKTSNTIPVSFCSCCGTYFTAKSGANGTETSVFRIEAIRDRRFVTLRLLIEVAEANEEAAAAITYTPYTCILDLECVGAMQCFEPIDIPTCGL